MNSKKSKRIKNKAQVPQSPHAPIRQSKKIQNSEFRIRMGALVHSSIKVLPRLGRFIWQALVVLFLLSVIFSMIAIPLLVVFG